MNQRPQTARSVTWRGGANDVDRERVAAMSAAQSPRRCSPAGGEGGRLLGRYVAWKGELQRRREARRAARRERDEIYSRIDDELDRIDELRRGVDFRPPGYQPPGW